MTREHTATYLNDHLAGSVAAIELLEYLQKSHAGTSLESFLRGLHDGIEADRDELESLMSRLNVTQSKTRKSVAWLSEKISELKLRMDDPAGGALQLLEGLEVLAVGIEGKKALWRALATAAEESSELRIANYDLLERV